MVTEDVPAPPDGRTAARRIGHYAWVERRLFEVLGGWVPEMPELDVKLTFGVQAHHHAWHADLWQQRLPVRPGADAGALVVPAAGRADVMEAVAGCQATLERLVAVYRVVLPRLIAAYTAHLRTVGPVADGPVRRALRLVLRDDHEDWRDGELLLQARLTSPAVVAQAAEHQRRLESLVVTAVGFP